MLRALEHGGAYKSSASYLSHMLIALLLSERRRERLIIKLSFILIRKWSGCDFCVLAAFGPFKSSHFKVGFYLFISP